MAVPIVVPPGITLPKIPMGSISMDSDSSIGAGVKVQGRLKEGNIVPSRSSRGRLKEDPVELQEGDNNVLAIDVPKVLAGAGAGVVDAAGAGAAAGAAAKEKWTKPL